MFDAERSPEDVFNQFFGGGAGRAFTPFGQLPALGLIYCQSRADSSIGGGMGGPGFVFNMGGGPGIRVHQFEGMGPRRRPRNAAGQEDPPASGLAALAQLLPILLLFILPLLSSLFTGSVSSEPEVRFHPSPPNTLHRTTPRFQVNYYLDPRAVDDYSDRKLRQLDQKAEVKYINTLKYECQVEHADRSRLLEEAQGWFSTDERKILEARAMPMKSCKLLNELGVSRQY
jgi:DnaJ homolog subfamily B member 12